MTNTEKLVLVGAISVAHGIRGHVVVKSYTETPENILKLDLIDRHETPIKLHLIRWAKSDPVCKVNNITDRTEAEQLKGTQLFCLRSSMPKIEDDEDTFYIEDLKNMPVVGKNLTPLGKVVGILNFGAGDIIEVKFSDNKTELFPFVKEIFPVITNDYIMIKQ